MAEHGPTCLAEAFQDRVIDRLRDVPYLVGFRLVREISLLDLSGNWLTAAGASQEINSGPRDVARRWSRAIHGAYAGIEGLWYPSKMAGGRFNLALYERAESALAPRPETDAALGDPALDAVIRNAARDFGYLVV